MWFKGATYGSSYSCNRTCFFLTVEFSIAKFDFEKFQIKQTRKQTQKNCTNSTNLKNLLRPFSYSPLTSASHCILFSVVALHYNSCTRPKILTTEQIPVFQNFQTRISSSSHSRLLFSRDAWKINRKHIFLSSSLSFFAKLVETNLILVHSHTHSPFSNRPFG